MEELPVYLFWGFLESGKTSFVKDTLSEDYFNDGERTMILSFEEGEVEYDQQMLDQSNAFVISLDCVEDFNVDFMISCQKNYHPDRVMIEYNGMYPIEPLMDVVDETSMELYQIIVTVDASTADVYLKNMKSIFVEMFKMADLVIFNRCDDETNVPSYRRSIKAVNPQAQIGFERADGREMEKEEILPYRLEDEMIQIQEEDYGIWYIDMMERPQLYDGKIVEFKAKVHRPPKIPAGYIVPGRHAMTCCEDDITFIGYLCRLDKTKSKTLKRVLDKEWVTVTARIRVEYHEIYGEVAPVLYAKRIESAKPPEKELIYF